MPAVQYRARTNRAHTRACAQRQPTNTHNTARAEEKRDRKEEQEREREEVRRGTGKWKGR